MTVRSDHAAGEAAISALVGDGGFLVLVHPYAAGAATDIPGSGARIKHLEGSDVMRSWATRNGRRLTGRWRVAHYLPSSVAISVAN